MATFVPNPAGLHVLLDTPTGSTGRFMLRTAIRVENAAKAKCPVDTGRLRASIGVAQQGDNSVIVQATADYAIYVHDGTRYMRARPFLRDALNEVVGGLR